MATTSDIAQLLESYSSECALYDFSDWSSLFQDEAGTQPVSATGQTVMLVLDQTSNGIDTSQSSSSDAPTIEQDSDGNYYLAFDGSSDYLVTPSVDLTTSAQLTTFLGVRKLVDSFGVICGQGDATSESGAWEVAMSSALSDGVNRQDYRIQLSNGGDATVQETEEIFEAPITNVLTGYFDFSGGSGDKLEFRVDGDVSHGVDSTGASTRSGFLNVPFYIGSRTGGSPFAEIRLYSLAFVGAELSDADRGDVEEYVESKTREGVLNPVPSFVSQTVEQTSASLDLFVGTTNASSTQVVANTSLSSVTEVQPTPANHTQVAQRTSVSRVVALLANNALHPHVVGTPHVATGAAPNVDVQKLSAVVTRSSLRAQIYTSRHSLPGFSGVTRT